MTNKKSIVMVILLSMYVFALQGQNSGWDWVRSFGGVEVNSYDYANPGERFDFLASDQSNNIYVAGRMLDEAIAGDIHLHGNGDFDVVVAKLNPQGQYIWATNLGGTKKDLPTGLSLDANGNVYLTGLFSGTLKVGGFTLQSWGYSDIFVAKITSEGIWQWVSQAGSQIAREDEFEGEILDELGEFSFDIQTNEQGSSVVLGIAHGLAQFGSNSLNCRGEEWFLASIDTGGNWTWAKSLGERINGEKIYSMAMTLDREHYILSVASAGSEDEIIEPGVGYTPDIPGLLLISKHNLNGETLWETTTSMSPLYIKRLISDETGNVYIAGIGDVVGYGEQSLHEEGIAFVAKVDSLGSYNWIRVISSDNYEASTFNLAIGSDSKLYVLSETSNLVGGFPYRAIESHHAMLSAYDTDGKFLWAQSFGEGSSEISFKAPGLILDTQNRIIVSGNFDGEVSLGQFRLNSDYWSDAFVGRFLAPGR
ncbi:MAG TPA: hypothetical protein PLN17_03095 [Candidatus Cloacimonas sp.]|nr:hypothetical protein [Candidatus Cloacimonas sp.]